MDIQLNKQLDSHLASQLNANLLDGRAEFETEPCRRTVGLSGRRMVGPNLRLNPVGGRSVCRTVGSPLR